MDLLQHIHHNYIDTTFSNSSQQASVFHELLNHHSVQVIGKPFSQLTASSCFQAGLIGILTNACYHKIKSHKLIEEAIKCTLNLSSKLTELEQFSDYICGIDFMTMVNEPLLELV